MVKVIYSHPGWIRLVETLVRYEADVKEKHF